MPECTYCGYDVATPCKNEVETVGCGAMHPTPVITADNQAVMKECAVPFERVERTHPPIGYPKNIRSFGVNKYVAHCCGEDEGAWHPFRHWLEIVDAQGHTLSQGETTIYESIAMIRDEAEGQTYIAVTEYFAGLMPTEQPLRISNGGEVENPYVLQKSQTREGHIWICRDCGFKCLDISAAAYHTEEVKSMSHWLYEYPMPYDANSVAMREMHGSDQGWPPYVSELPYKKGG